MEEYFVRKYGITKKAMKMAVCSLTVAALAVTMTGCDNGDSQTSQLEEATPSNLGETTKAQSTVTAFEVVSKIDDADADVDWHNEDYITITGNGTDITCDSDKVSIQDGVVTISKKGIYVISGTISQGQIQVDAEDKKVWIVLNGAEITCQDSAAIYVKNAKKVIVTAEADTENTLTDGETYTYEDAEKEVPNACLYAEDDLVINGTGKLTINGNCNNGITGKNDVLIVNTELTVTAANHGIKGKDCICTKDAAITVTAGGDGIKTTNGDEENLGFVCMEGGSAVIQAEQDGIDCETCMRVTDTKLDIQSGGGAAKSTKTHQDDFGGGGGWNQNRGGNSQDSTSTDSTTDTTESTSTKGIKAGSGFTLENTEVTIDSADDGIHTNGDAAIESGTVEIASGDDGIHADVNLNLNGGTISITKSYEGLEAQYININDGTIDVVSSDDGLNASTGTSNGGMAVEDAQITINGGELTVNADGDGIDSNGTIVMNDGNVLVYGPTNGGNGALDYGSTFQMVKGTLVASGATGMDESISDNSTQYGCKYVATTTIAANSEVVITAEDGTVIAQCTNPKTSQSIVFSTPDMQDGMTYTVTINGTEDGTITQSGITTSNGTTTMGGGGQGGGGQGGGKGGKDNQTQDGETQTMPDGEVPSMPDGETPATPDGGEMPSMGDGEMPSMGDGEMPSMPDGQMPDGQAPGNTGNEAATASGDSL
jgi:hypothetical protein